MAVGLSGHSHVRRANERGATEASPRPEAAAKIGVAQFATKFEEIARQHDNTSRSWLWATGILATITIAVAIGFLFVLPPVGEIKNAATIQRIVTKLVVISIFYFAAIWAARNYRAHRHLAVVNSHRQSALSTFETFVKASEDEQMKNAVLLEATRCIFTAGGYGLPWRGRGEPEQPDRRDPENRQWLDGWRQGLMGWFV